MKKKFTDYFANKASFVVVFVLLSVFLADGNFGQTAFAEDKSIEFLYVPGIEALTAFATGVAESAPKIIASIILLIIGLIAGKVIGKAVEKSASKILHKVHKDDKNDKDHSDEDLIAQTASLNDSSKLISGSVRWFVYLFFIIAAINALEFSQLSTALTDLWLWVPNLLAFILIIIVGIIIVNFIGKWLDQELIKKEFGGSKYIVTGIKVVLYAVIFAISLTQLGIGESIIPILVSAFSWSIAVGVGAAIAIGLGFALKDIIPAAISSSSKQRSFLTVGQKVKIGEHVGTITAVELLHLILATDANQSIIIPTKNLDTGTIIVFGAELE